MHCISLFQESFSGQVNICYHFPNGQVVEKLISTQLIILMSLANAKEAFNFCKTAMPTIFFYFLPKENLSEVCQS